MKKHYLTLLLTILLAMSASAQTATSKSLKDIIDTGKQGATYMITDELVGVYVPPRYKNVVFAKDNNNCYDPSQPTSAQTTNGKIYDNINEFDQSNWVKIYFPSGYDASAYEGKRITNVTGMVNVSSAPKGPTGIYVTIDTQNESKIPVIAGDAPSYDGNLYCCANFVKQQWFFVRPKNLEYARMHWAVYNGNNKFLVPDNTDFPGSVTIKMDLWEEQNADNSVTADDVFHPFYVYDDFPVIIQFSKNKQIGVGIDPGWGGEDFAPAVTKEEGVGTGNPGTIPAEYVNVDVYPLRLPTPGIVTAVEQVETASEVESVQYYDLQGRMSNAPLKGVNIKVTTYTDGTRETKKIVR